MKKYLVVLGGTFVEYYDYTLYSFTAIYFARHFFPADKFEHNLLKAFIVFAVAYVAKPLGAFVFSYFGDHHGRSKPLKWTMLGVALPTLLIGVLPTFAQWGWVATACLIACRFLQGFLLAGEYDGAALYIQENIPKKYACFGNSLLGLTYSAGILMASVVSAWSSQFFTNELAWRFPYLLGGMIGLFMLLMRRAIPETYDYATSNDTPLHFWDLIKSNGLSILGAMLICGSSGAIYQFVIVFWPVFMRETLGVWSSETVYQVSTFLAIFTFTKPLIGLLADKVGPESFLKWGVGLFSLALLYLIYLVQNGDYSLAWYNVLIVALSCYGLSGHVLMTKYIPVKQRYRCINLGHAMGSLLFSGPTPAIAMWVWMTTARPDFPLYYLLGFAPLTLLGLLLLQYNHQRWPYISKKVHPVNVG